MASSGPAAPPRRPRPATFFPSPRGLPPTIGAWYDLVTEPGGAAMPVHDWTRVDAGTFHAFHTSWLTHLMEALNAGLLPEGYYALSEQVATRMQTDVLTLRVPRPLSLPPGGLGNGGVAVAEAPPRARFCIRPDPQRRPRRPTRRGRAPPPARVFHPPGPAAPPAPPDPPRPAPGHPPRQRPPGGGAGGDRLAVEQGSQGPRPRAGGEGGAQPGGGDSRPAAGPAA